MINLAISMVAFALLEKLYHITGGGGRHERGASDARRRTSRPRRLRGLDVLYDACDRRDRRLPRGALSRLAFGQGARGGEEQRDAARISRRVRATVSSMSDMRSPPR